MRGACDGVVSIAAENIVSLIKYIHKSKNSKKDSIFATSFPSIEREVDNISIMAPQHF
jgi:hypothetical protein